MVITSNCRQVSPTPQHVCGPPESTKRALARCLNHLIIPTNKGEPVHPIPGQRQERTDRPQGRPIQYQQRLDRLSHQSHRLTCSTERFRIMTPDSSVAAAVLPVPEHLLPEH